MKDNQENAFVAAVVVVVAAAAASGWVSGWLGGGHPTAVTHTQTHTER